ncbi:MAG: beta-N-acetylhexosaminidase [Clostridia bacterium]|nr:beta-N-acetylhexosaminidase [Clostridia bacterium]
MENRLLFETLGTMVDCSRNAVPNLKALKKWIDLTASLGYNTLLLYTEDTYTVEGEPYFGYMRGRFTPDELREADRYAAGKGMVLMPCIQVLAHMNQLKRWSDYRSHFDVDDILLAGDERVYQLIDRMFAAVASCFSCKTVNIGMDEAHALGRGRYYDLHGDCDRTRLMLDHLSRVCEIGKKYGFRFQIWSDMFFRLVSGGEYYNGQAEFSDEVRALIPDNVTLAYWDYYHTDKRDYDAMIEAHDRLHPGTWFYGGLWTWTGFAPHNGFSMLSSKAALESCLEHGVRHVVMTLWGDGGAECSRFALLPSLFYVSELAKGNADEELIRQRFLERFGIPFDSFMQLDLIGTRTGDRNACCNQEKFLLYNDCFLGLLDSQVPSGAAEQYAGCADRLERLKDHPEWGYLFETQAALGRVLEKKADLGIRTHAAYRSRDPETLRALIADYEALDGKLRSFHAALRRQWLRDNKPQGFEVQDIRLGGLMQRVASCRERLTDLLEGRIGRIEELEEEQLEYRAGRDGQAAPTFNVWKEIVSPSVVAGQY